MKNKWIYFVAGILFIAILIYILKSGLFSHTTNKTASNKSVQVSASFYPLYFFASQIGGDKAVVNNITPAGAEPHDFEPSPKDIAGIENSQLLVLNGGVEGWGDKVKNNLKGKSTVIVTAGKDLLTKSLVEEGQSIKDPHVWLDPKLAKVEAAKITDGLASVDPKNKDYYITNQNNLNNELDKLDSEYRIGLANCEKKDIITSHAAFAYLAQEYGLNQVAISGISPDEEPSTKQLAEVAKFAKDNNVKYIFFESLVSPKLSQTIANEVGAQTLVLDPIEGIPDDNIKKGDNYFTIMRSNLKNLEIALQCKETTPTQ
ncbi:MAG TPA: zinc ABC transporter substrate-binding protein [Patescibacteria group bacterium]|nr:zinc ABC transporter substrate-binding protein [Patescibacteria group bacterium]